MTYGFNRITRSTVYMVILVSLGLGCMVMVMFFWISQLKQSYHVISHINKALVLAGEARRSEKDFLLKDFNNEVFIRTGKSAFFDKNQEILQKIDSLVISLQTNKICQSSNIQTSLASLQEDFKHYNISFETIGSLYRQRGFDDMGLEGQMRVAVYFVEEANFPTDKTDLLLLRREEKDFFLRKDEHYIQTFSYQLNKFQSKIDSIIGTGKSPEIGDHVKAALETYGVVFFNIVEIEKKVGLNEDQGLRKEMNISFLKIQNNIAHIQNEINKGIQIATGWIIGVGLLLVSLLLAIIVVGNHFLKHRLILPIQQLETITTQVAEGNIDTIVNIDQPHSSLDGLLHAFSKVIGRLQQTTVHLADISDGKLDTEIIATSERDKLNLSLLHLTKQLRLLKEEEAQQNWINIGYTTIAEILQRNAEITLISHEVLKEVIHYLKASQGAIFVEIPNTDLLEMTACIAFDKKKHLQKQIDKSTGLVGQCWKEGESIYLKQVPENYTFISSGLGDSTPRSILLIPLIANNTKEGVLELASFRYFMPHEIIFLEKVAQSIASTFAHLKMLNELQQRKNYASL